MSRTLSLATCAVILWAAPARAQADDPPIARGGQGWSILAGQTVGRGANVIAGQLGWPGLSITWLHGADRNIDLGVRLTPLNYGFEGRTEAPTPGIKLQAVGRLGLVDRGRFSLAVEFAPGPLAYFRSGGRVTQWGLALPLKLQMGFGVGSALLLNAGLDVPMFVTFGFPSSLYVPILFGGGAEYFIDRRMSVSFNLRVGPSIATAFDDTRFAMDALIGVAYRF